MSVSLGVFPVGSESHGHCTILRQSFQRKMAHAAKRLKVDEKAAWTEARLKLLEEEKALSKQVAELAAKRQALPRLEVKTIPFPLDLPSIISRLRDRAGV